MQRAGAEEVRIASYNVENMFDVFDDPYTQDEGTDIKFREEIQQIAGAIRYLNADVVAFCEVENEHVLKAMIKEFLPNMGYKHVVVAAGNDGRGIKTGLISRKPIVKVTSYRWQEFTLPGEKRSWKFARDLMHVTLQATKDKTMDVFVVHFKSKRDSKNDVQSVKWRLAEATQAKKIMDEILIADPKAWVAIMGDFNDTLGSPTLKAFLKDGDLVDAHAGIDESERITYLHKPHRSTIDFLLTSKDLANREVEGSEVVVSEEHMTKGSDHAPIAASFRLD